MFSNLTEPRAASFYLALAMTLALSSCPGPSPVGGPVSSDQLRETCSDALDLMVQGSYPEAVDLLRTRSAERPEQTPDPQMDICLGRALIGTGSCQDAMRLLVPLQADETLDSSVTNSSCLYGAWATAVCGDLAAARDQIDRCDAGAVLDPSDLLLPADGIPATFVLFDSRSRRGSAVDALLLASRLIQSYPAADDPTRAWVMERAFSLGMEATEQELGMIADMPQDLPQAVVLYAELSHAMEVEQPERIQALASQVRSRLSDLSAQGPLLQLEEWLSGHDQAQPALFGAVLSLTGPERPASRAALAGLLLAERVFDRDVPPESRLLIVDSGESEDSARAAVASLENQGALAIIAYVSPDLLEGVADQAQASGLPCIMLTEHPSVVDGRPFIFRLFPDPQAEARALLAFAEQEGLAHIAVAIPLPTPDYMQALVTSFVEQARTTNLTVDEPLAYELGDLQREAQAVSQILAMRDFDGLLVADTPQHATTLAAYLAVQDIWTAEPGESPGGSRRQVHYLGNHTWHDPGFLASGPDYLAGAVFATWLPLELSQNATIRFIDGFTRVYDRRSGTLEAFAHDALLVLRFIGIDSGLRGRNAVRQALEQIDVIEGATGPIRFGSQRIRWQIPWLLTVTPQGFVPL